MSEQPSTGHRSSNGPSLREYFEKLLDAHQDLHNQHDNSHAREHLATQEAIDVAAKNVATNHADVVSKVEENKKDANEWRDTMDDRERNFAKMRDYEQLMEKVRTLENAELRRTSTEGDVKVLQEKTNRLEASELERLTTAKVEGVTSTKQRELERERQLRQQWAISVGVGIAIFLLTRVANEF